MLAKTVWRRRVIGAWPACWETARFSRGAGLVAKLRGRLVALLINLLLLFAGWVPGGCECARVRIPMLLHQGRRKGRPATRVEDGV